MCAVVHIMSIISVKCTKIHYLQLCVSAENLIYSYENPQKLLPSELILLAQICTKSFVGCRGLRPTLHTESLQRPQIP